LASITSVRSNSQPTGGTTATQPVPPTTTPADIQALIEELTPVIAKFRAQSSQLQASLKQVVLTGQVQGSTRIASVGLGYALETEHVMALTLDNTATAAVSVDVSPLFPFNLLAKTEVAINGGATVFSADGVGTLYTGARSRTGFFKLSTEGGFGPALPPSTLRISLPSGITATNTDANVRSLSGIASLSVAASTSATITMTFYTYERLVLDELSMLGALPLQNNSTWADLTRQQNAPLGTNQRSGLYIAAGVPSTLTATLTDTVNTTYDFCSVPSDPALYTDMVQNSFQIQQAQNLTADATGAEALTYDIPQNNYLVALHVNAYDGNGASLQPQSIDPLRLEYNAGGIKPIVRYAGRQRARIQRNYGDDRMGNPGYWLFDGEDTTGNIKAADNMGWLDTYMAATPQIVADILSTVATPVNFSVTREAVVAGSVSVVGG